jgi:hypothetical protein
LFLVAFLLFRARPTRNPADAQQKPRFSLCKRGERRPGPPPAPQNAKRKTESSKQQAARFFVFFLGGKKGDAASISLLRCFL